jgi:hypothetical protein
VRRIWRCSAVLVALSIAACSSSELPEVSAGNLAIRVEPDCRAARNAHLTSAMFEFLPSSFGARAVSTASQVLASMEEPILWCGTLPDGYRLLWMHSFSGHPPTRSRWPPTMVRMSQERGVWTSTVVQLASLINQRDVIRRTRTLSGAESREMLLAVSAFGPWTRKDFAQDVSVLDGATWLVEARLTNRYHPIILVNAAREEIDRLAAVFWRLGGLDAQMLHEGIDVPEP